MTHLLLFICVLLGLSLTPASARANCSVYYLDQGSGDVAEDTWINYTVYNGGACYSDSAYCNYGSYWNNYSYGDPSMGVYYDSNNCVPLPMDCNTNLSDTGAVNTPHDQSIYYYSMQDNCTTQFYANCSNGGYVPQNGGPDPSGQYSNPTNCPIFCTWRGEGGIPVGATRMGFNETSPNSECVDVESVTMTCGSDGNMQGSGYDNCTPNPSNCSTYIYGTNDYFEVVHGQTGTSYDTGNNCSTMGYEASCSFGNFSGTVGAFSNRNACMMSNAAFNCQFTMDGVTSDYGHGDTTPSFYSLDSSNCTSPITSTCNGYNAWNNGISVGFTSQGACEAAAAPCYLPNDYSHSNPFASGWSGTLYSSPTGSCSALGSNFSCFNGNWNTDVSGHQNASCSFTCNYNGQDHNPGLVDTRYTGEFSSDCGGIAVYLTCNGDGTWNTDPATFYTTPYGSCTVGASCGYNFTDNGPGGYPGSYNFTHDASLTVYTTGSCGGNPISCYNGSWPGDPTSGTGFYDQNACYIASGAWDCSFYVHDQSQYVSIAHGVPEQYWTTETGCADGSASITCSATTMNYSAGYSTRNACRYAQGDGPCFLPSDWSQSSPYEHGWSEMRYSVTEGDCTASEVTMNCENTVFTINSVSAPDPDGFFSYSGTCTNICDMPDGTQVADGNYHTVYNTDASTDCASAGKTLYCSGITIHDTTNGWSTTGFEGHTYSDCTNQCEVYWENDYTTEAFDEGTPVTIYDDMCGNYTPTCTSNGWDWSGNPSISGWSGPTGCTCDLPQGSTINDGEPTTLFSTDASTDCNGNGIALNCSGDTLTDMWGNPYNSGNGWGGYGYELCTTQCEVYWNDTGMTDYYNWGDPVTVYDDACGSSSHTCYTDYGWDYSYNPYLSGNSTPTNCGCSYTFTDNGPSGWPGSHDYNDGDPLTTYDSSCASNSMTCSATAWSGDTTGGTGYYDQDVCNIATGAWDCSIGGYDDGISATHGNSTTSYSPGSGCVDIVSNCSQGNFDQLGEYAHYDNCMIAGGLWDCVGVALTQGSIDATAHTGTAVTYDSTNGCAEINSTCEMGIFSPAYGDYADQPTCISETVTTPCTFTIDDINGVITVDNGDYIQNGDQLSVEVGATLHFWIPDEGNECQQELTMTCDPDYSNDGAWSPDDPGISNYGSGTSGWVDQTTCEAVLVPDSCPFYLSDGYGSPDVNGAIDTDYATYLNLADGTTINFFGSGTACDYMSATCIDGTIEDSFMGNQDTGYTDGPQCYAAAGAPCSFTAADGDYSSPDATGLYDTDYSSYLTVYNGSVMTYYLVTDCNNQIFATCSDSTLVDNQNFNQNTGYLTQGACIAGQECTLPSGSGLANGASTLIYNEAASYQCSMINQDVTCENGTLKITGSSVNYYDEWYAMEYIYDDCTQQCQIYWTETGMTDVYYENDPVTVYDEFCNSYEWTCTSNGWENGGYFEASANDGSACINQSCGFTYEDPYNTPEVTGTSWPYYDDYGTSADIYHDSTLTFFDANAGNGCAPLYQTCNNTIFDLGYTSGWITRGGCIAALPPADCMLPSGNMMSDNTEQDIFLTNESADCNAEAVHVHCRGGMLHDGTYEGLDYGAYNQDSCSPPPADCGNFNAIDNNYGGLSVGGAHSTDSSTYLTLIETGTVDYYSLPHGCATIHAYCDNDSQLKNQDAPYDTLPMEGYGDLDQCRYAQGDGPCYLPSDPSHIYPLEHGWSETRYINDESSDCMSEETIMNCDNGSLFIDGSPAGDPDGFFANPESCTPRNNCYVASDSNWYNFGDPRTFYNSDYGVCAATTLYCDHDGMGGWENDNYDAAWYGYVHEECTEGNSCYVTSEAAWYNYDDPRTFYNEENGTCVGVTLYCNYTDNTGWDNESGDGSMNGYIYENCALQCDVYWQDSYTTEYYDQGTPVTVYDDACGSIEITCGSNGWDNGGNFSTSSHNGLTNCQCELPQGGTISDGTPTTLFNTDASVDCNGNGIALNCSGNTLTDVWGNPYNSGNGWGGYGHEQCTPQCEVYWEDNTSSYYNWGDPVTVYDDMCGSSSHTCYAQYGWDYSNNPYLLGNSTPTNCGCSYTFTDNGPSGWPGSHDYNDGDPLTTYDSNGCTSNSITCSAAAWNGDTTGGIGYYDLNACNIATGAWNCSFYVTDQGQYVSIDHGNSAQYWTTETGCDDNSTDISCSEATLNYSAGYSTRNACRYAQGDAPCYLPSDWMHSSPYEHGMMNEVRYSASEGDCAAMEMTMTCENRTFFVNGSPESNPDGFLANPSSCTNICIMPDGTPVADGNYHTVYDTPASTDCASATKTLYCGGITIYDTANWWTWGFEYHNYSECTPQCDVYWNDNSSTQTFNENDTVTIYDDMCGSTGHICTSSGWDYSGNPSTSGWSGPTNCQCDLPQGGTLADGGSTTIYNTGASVDCSGNGVSLTCSGNTLYDMWSGSYSSGNNWNNYLFENCDPQCEVYWEDNYTTQTFNIGDPVTVYDNACGSTDHTCYAEGWDYSYNYSLSGNSGPTNCECLLPQGGSLSNGNPTTLYSVGASADCNAYAINLTCDGNALRDDSWTYNYYDWNGWGGYGFEQCDPQCEFNGEVVAESASVTAYEFEFAETHGGCVSEERTCNNSVLEGSFTYAYCYDACLLEGDNEHVMHGQTTPAHRYGIAPLPGDCSMSEERYCEDGSFTSGSFTFLNCDPGTVPECD